MSRLFDFLFPFDAKILLWMHRNQNETFIFFWKVLSHWALWVVLFALLFLWLYQHYKGKAFFYILFLFGLTFLATDQLAGVLKRETQRLRPCRVEGLREHLTLSDPCSGTHGFVSAHAANSMGIAVLAFFLQKKHRKTMLAVFFWVLLVGLSRMGLGVHYATDVVGGWILGALAAVFVSQCFARWMPQNA